MTQYVRLETSFVFSGVIALGASKRLLTTVNQHMAFQSARPITCIVALVATVGLRSHALLGMFCKIVDLHFHFSPRLSFKVGG